MNARTELAFVDTNIFVYALDGVDIKKSAVALGLVGELHAQDTLVVSPQVIREFFNVFSKSEWGLSLNDAKQFAEQILKPNSRLIESYEFVTGALKIYQEHGTSFYDALILQAAIESGCTTLYSEDLQHGRTYDTVTVINPFL
jgi:predicted nucleic acid-binding protein